MIGACPLPLASAGCHVVPWPPTATPYATRPKTIRASVEDLRMARILARDAAHEAAPHITFDCGLSGADASLERTRYLRERLSERRSSASRRVRRPGVSDSAIRR